MFKKIVSLVIFSLFVSVQVCYCQKDDIVKAAVEAKGGDALVDTSQKSGVWVFKGNFQLAFNQFYANREIGVGDPYVGLGTLDHISLLYKKNKFAWHTTLDLDFGERFTYKADEDSNKWHNGKTTDKIELNSQIGYKAGGYWYYTALLTTSTQVAKGYTNDTILRSAFMTPGDVKLSLGMEYKRTSWSWYISPLAGKLSCKLNKYFFDQALFGVDSGKKVFASVGAFTRIAYNADIHPKINLNTKLEFFYNYLGEYKHLRNLATNFEMIWNFSITDWLSVSFKTSLVYDYTIKFPVFDKDGVEIHQTDHLQFQESFGLLLGYKFRIPKK
jgi:hypothetical protein